MDGIVILDKEKNMTSFQAVSRVKYALGEKKAGHTGTLDPNATGVLPVLLGKATKLAPFVVDSEKEYIADFKFGIKTDTLDIWGKVVDICDSSFVTRKLILKALEDFKGKIMQVPPMYSAISKNGVRLYELARKGMEIERSSREVEIFDIELISFDENTKEGKIKVLCGKGTYIRSLIDDIGRKLGCFCVMTELRRTKNCGFSIEEAVELKKISADNIISPEKLLEKYPSLNIFGFGAKLVKSGQEIKLLKYFDDCDEGYVRLYENGFLGLGVIRSESKEKFLNIRDNNGVTVIRTENKEKFLKAYLIF